MVINQRPDAHDDDAGTHELTPEQQASVLVGIEEADRGEIVSADEVMAALRRSQMVR